MSDYHPEGTSPWDYELNTEDRRLVGLAADLLEEVIERRKRVQAAIDAGKTVPDPDGSLLHDFEVDAAFRKMRARQ